MATLAPEVVAAQVSRKVQTFNIILQLLSRHLATAIHTLKGCVGGDIARG